jgi:hypothetical protein
LDQNRDYSDTERTRNEQPLQKIKHFVLLCNKVFGAQSQPISGNERNKYIKNLCCSGIIKYFRAAQKSLLLFCGVHRNKQKYFDAFALLWDDTQSTNCPGRAGFAKARYMKSFSIYFGV